ncbi:MAG: sulfatase-like hydrolase/transferase [Phycisphaeraceae bacterium]
MRCIIYLFVCISYLFFCSYRTSAETTRPPNIIVFLIDDMGYADLGCFGGIDAPTPNIDKLASQGLRLTRFYVNSPICSPSRVALTTGRYPTRYGITGHFASRKQNAERGMPDYLDPEAPTLAKTLKSQGYTTAHFGKWHMGGGRDVGDAPHPGAYGFDRSLVCFEGLGPRVLINNDGLSKQSAKLSAGDHRFVEKHELTGIYVDHALQFIEQNKDKPFYLRVFPNDVHDPFRPTRAMLDRHADKADNPYRRAYAAVIEEMDKQFGRVFDKLDALGLTDDTIVVLTSDNGPTAWASYYRQGIEPPGSTGGLRGRKWSLYEGGIREPFIIRWPGKVPGGAVDTQSVVVAMDLFPTLVAMAGVRQTEAYDLDGLDRSAAMLGHPIPERGAPIFWAYGFSDRFIQPGDARDRSPSLAMRDGGWKLLMHPDGTGVELYHVSANPNEVIDLAEREPARVQGMKAQLSAWWQAVQRESQTRWGQR